MNGFNRLTFTLTIKTIYELFQQKYIIDFNTLYTLYIIRIYIMNYNQTYNF